MRPTTLHIIAQWQVYFIFKKAISLELSECVCAIVTSTKTVCCYFCGRLQMHWKICELNMTLVATTCGAVDTSALLVVCKKFAVCLWVFYYKLINIGIQRRPHARFKLQKWMNDEFFQEQRFLPRENFAESESLAEIIANWWEFQMHSRRETISEFDNFIKTENPRQSHCALWNNERHRWQLVCESNLKRFDESGTRYLIYLKMRSKLMIKIWLKR